MERKGSTQSAADGVITLPGSRSPRDAARALKVGTQTHSREYVVAMQRDRLIDAFVQVVAEKGYESAWIKTICQRAGVAFNAFYDHFESKESLFLAAYDAGVEILFNATSAAYLAGDVPWRERVEVGLHTFLQALADNPLFARFFVLEIRKAGDEARDRTESSIEAASAMFTNVSPAPGVNIPTAELVPLVVGSIYEQIYFYIRADRITELPQLEPLLTKFTSHVFANADFGGEEAHDQSSERGSRKHRVTGH